MQAKSDEESDARTRAHSQSLAKWKVVFSEFRAQRFRSAMRLRIALLHQRVV
jgi:hypothetical protein